MALVIGGATSAGGITALIVGKLHVQRRLHDRPRNHQPREKAP